MNVIEPLHFTKGVQTIHLGHIDELHYVSTVKLDFAPSPVNNNTVLVTAETNLTLSKENDLKRKRNAYMREYRKKRETVGDKEKTNAYMREYRKKGPGPDRNRKNHNAHRKKCRATKHYEQNNHLPQVNCTIV